MKNSYTPIKEIIFKVINYIGVNDLFRYLNKSKDLCLMYHGIVPDDYPIESWLLVKESNFRKQLEYIKKHWEVVHIEAYMKSEFNTYRPKAILTFDDGYQNTYSVVYPILKDLNLPCTLYVITDFIGTNDLFWFDKVIYALQKKSIRSLDLSKLCYELDKYNFDDIGKKRWRRIKTILTRIKKLGPEKVEEVAQKIFESVNPDTLQLNLLMPLTKLQIIEMAKTGLVEIGTHTAHHEILTDLTIEQAEQTIIRSMETVNKIIGKYPTHFCYPNGNYSEEILELIKRFNFDSAMSVRNDFINPKNFKKYEIPRISVGVFDSIHLFKAKVSGFRFFLRNIVD